MLPSIAALKLGEDTHVASNPVAGREAAASDRDSRRTIRKTPRPAPQAAAPLPLHEVRTDLLPYLEELKDGWRGQGGEGEDAVMDEMTDMTDQEREMVKAAKAATADSSDVLKEDEATFDFVYRPLGKGLKNGGAEFELTFHFEPQEDSSRLLTNVSLKHSSGKCVNCNVDREKNVAYITSLYFNVTKDQRINCGVELETDAKKGEGSILLGAIVEVAAAIGLQSLYLTDAAQFFTVETAPFWGKLHVTEYLRMMRGYGQYERAGFFESCTDVIPYGDVEQSVLDANHVRMTTPVKDLFVNGVFTHDNLTQHNLFKNEAVQKFPNWSLREILEAFEKKVENYRPKVEDVPTLTLPTLQERWEVKAGITGEGEMTPERTALQNLYSAARAIIRSDGILAGSDAFRGKRKLFVFKGAEDALTVHHKVVRIINGWPMAIVEPLPVEYFFRKNGTR